MLRDLNIALIIVTLAGVGNGISDVRVDVLGDAVELLGTEIEDGKWSIESNTLAFGRRDLEYFSGGTMEAGRFTFLAIPGTASLDMLDHLTGYKYRIDHAHIGERAGYLHILNADIVASAANFTSDVFAVVDEITIGTVNISTPWSPPPEPEGGDLPSCPTNFGPSIDVALSQLNMLQQIARQAGVQVSISMSTQLSNIGSNDVPWFWAIDPPGVVMPIIGQHPFAVFQFYRLFNGEFRQIGKSQVKHAFYSTNTGCDCPGAQIIYSGCQDTYGVGNNSDQFYFAPREEVHIFSGSWESLGSHFDVTAAEPTPDDFRSHDGEDDGFTHLLVIPESLLMETGAQYFVEAWYIVKDDTNQYNNIGFRRVTPSFSGSLWSFAFNTTLSNSPAIDVFVPRNESSSFRSHRVVDTSEGNIHLAVNVTPIGGGMYRYQYALMNLNFDRGLKEINFPVSPGLIITNKTFFDSDIIASNNWAIGHHDQQITVSMMETNALAWGSLFHFGFDADAPPSPAGAGLTSHLTGTTDVFQVSSLAPGTHIADIAIPDGAELTWPSISGAVYEVEFNDAVTGPVWTRLGLSVTAAAPTFIMLDTNMPADQLFYRLKLLSAP